MNSGQPLSPERTLLDGLREPDLCGGIENVLRAWVTARDALEVATLVNSVERFNVDALRQRAGYL